MRDVKILGTGCANCRNTLALVDEIATEEQKRMTQQFSK